MEQSIYYWWWQIMTFIWFWYIPGFIGSLLTIECWLYDFGYGKIKVKHLFYSSILGFLGGWIVFAVFIFVFLFLSDSKERFMKYIPNNIKNFFNKEL